MNPKYHLLVAVAALSLGACSTDDTYTESENGEYKISFTVAEDPETRTTLDKDDKGRDILRWVPTDKVGIYTVGNSVNSNILTTADVNQSPVEFVGTLNQSVSSGDQFYAYYPYNAAQSDDPSMVKLSIPAVQKQAQAGVYNGESHPLVAVPMEFSQEWGNAGHISSVRFRQLGAIVELQLYSSDEALRGETISSVTFESETPLAGDFSFDLKNVTVKEELSISGYESKVVMTSLEEPAAIPAASNGAARVYLTIAPGQYTGQIVVKTDIAQYTFRLKNTKNFRRAVIKGLPADLAKAEREILPDASIHFVDPIVKQICVENWDTNSDGELSYKEAAAVTSIGSLFQDILIRSFNELQYFTGLRSIENYAFFGCGYLTSIGIPEEVTAIGEGAFSECKELTSIHIPNGVTTIGDYAFYNCWDLTSVDIPNGVMAIGDYTFYYCEGLTSIHLPNRLTTIGDWAFSACTSLTSIDIPDGVTSIGERAFWDCWSLTNIHLPNRLTTIGDCAFSTCYSLTSIDIPNGVTAIGEQAFSACTSLTSIHLPDRLTTIKSGAFGGCSSLTSINIPNGVTSIGVSAFGGCSSLKSIHLPDGVTSIGNYAFQCCSSLKSIHLPNGVTAIGEFAFYRCSSLKSILLPDGVTAIGDNAFEYCWSLTSVNIPEGVTAIGISVFHYCSSLTSITIPEGVTSIGVSAFEDCSSLTSVYCKPTIPPTLNSDFGSTALSPFRIYVPAASVAAYKKAEGWSLYELYIFADNN